MGLTIAVMVAQTIAMHGIPDAELEHDRTLYLPLSQVGSSDKVTTRFRQIVDDVDAPDERAPHAFEARAELHVRGQGATERHEACRPTRRHPARRGVEPLALAEAGPTPT